MFGYIGRHWRGALSLPQSFWINGVLISFVALLYFFVAVPLLESQMMPLSLSLSLSRGFTALVAFTIVPLLLYFPVFAWQGIGLWRSAGRDMPRGDPFWPWVARAAVLAGAILLVLGLRDAAPRYYSMWQAYQIDRAARFTIENHGSFVIFSGTITEGAADKLAPQLELPKTQRLIIVGSNGGFINPALRLARIINQRKLWVTAVGDCYSSCTGLVAAGATRAIAPDTIMGFHIGTIVGLDETAEEWAEIDEYYAADGMSQAMFDEVHAHRGPQEIYYPPVFEMIDNGVINAIYDRSLDRYVRAHEWCDAHADACARTGQQNRAGEKKT